MDLKNLFFLFVSIISLLLIGCDEEGPGRASIGNGPSLAGNDANVTPDDDPAENDPARCERLFPNRRTRKRKVPKPATTQPRLSKRLLKSPPSKGGRYADLKRIILSPVFGLKGKPSSLPVSTASCPLNPFS